MRYFLKGLGVVGSSLLSIGMIGAIMWVIKNATWVVFVFVALFTIWAIGAAMGSSE